MKWCEGKIIRAISRQTLDRKCVVLVDNCNWTGHECDVLAVTKDLRIIDIEVKISKADLKADAGKEKWWHRPNNWPFVGATGGWARHGCPAPDTSREWPPRVWKHYYAMPAEIWRPELVACLASPASGVLLLREQRNSTAPIAVSCKRRATPCGTAYRLTPADVIDIARLANLRMWSAYESLDARSLAGSEQD
jgi:hypothetical protein